MEETAVWMWTVEEAEADWGTCGSVSDNPSCSYVDAKRAEVNAAEWEVEVLAIISQILTWMW